MKLFKTLILAILLSVAFSYAGLEDRAFATHNVGRLGWFTTNIGQFYPYGGQFEKTLEYPINSGHIAMYRQCLMIGVPYNVISAADGRYEEFDAIGGYDAGNAEIAISDDPSTWPTWGWPVRDENGNPIILSQQDSYCVFSDSTNWRYANNGEQDALMDIRVHQTTYAWGVPTADRFIVLKFEIENASARPLQDMYFNFYSDIDVGGNANDAREWADDCIGFDKDRETIYFYDSDGVSDEWINDENNYPFPVGITFLQTPNNNGITDWHWIDVAVDEVRVNAAFWDSLSYNLMRSDTTWFHDHPDVEVSDYFHLGDNPINGTRYDDPETTRIMDEDGNLVGGAMVAYIANGPFDIQPGERAEFWVAVSVGDNIEDLMANIDQLWDYYPDFNIPVVGAPTVKATANDHAVDLSWDNQVELDDPDLQGYIVYRTTDQVALKQWEALDTIPAAYAGDSVYVEDAYQYQDSEAVYNGFSYIYNVSAYRENAAGLIEESNRLGSLDNIDNVKNAAIVQPVSNPAQNKADMDKIRVVPNPFVISARWDEERLGNYAFGEPVRNVSFTNLPAQSTVKIYTVDGDLVQTLQHNGPSGRLEWNMLSSEQRPVVSGIYFYHVKSDLGEKVGRFAIIR